MTRVRCGFASGLAIAVACLVPSTVGALKPGEILVADRQYGLIVVAPADGAQEYLTWGVSNLAFADVVSDATGSIFALNSGGQIVRVDAATGNVTPVSSAGYLTYSNFMDLSPDGSLLAQGGAPTHGLVRVDPVSGTQALVAPGLPVDALAIVDAGTAYVMSYPAGSISDWYLYRLDLTTGDTTRVSNYSFDNPRGLAVESSSSLIVTEYGGAVSRVFPALGAVAPLVSGPPFQYLSGVAVEDDGAILVADTQGDPSCNPPGPPSTCRGAVYRVDPVSGARAIVSEQGKFDMISGIDVYRGPDTTPAIRSSWGRVKSLYR